jgi:hypothetical protein
MQCPTLYNVGYGAHGIEGIGDKHVTWIHNVRNTDLLVCVDDQECIEGLQLLQEGRDILASELGLETSFLECMDGIFGISGICNILAAIHTAQHYQLGADDLILTVATDGFDRYPSVLRRLESQVGPQTRERACERLGIFHEPKGWRLEGTMPVRRRWHNQKYFTWVEQQGMSLEELEALWEPEFWEEHYSRVPDLDAATLAMR